MTDQRPDENSRTTPIEAAALIEGSNEDAADALVSSQAPVKVFDTTSTVEAEAILSLLQDEGVSATMNPLGSWAILGETSRYEILVPAEDEERVSSLISAYSASLPVEENVESDS